MKIERDTGISSFLGTVSPVLSREPAIHSFLLSLAKRTLDSNKKAPLLARGMSENGTLLVAAIQTDGNRPLIVSAADKDVAKEFARNLYDLDPSLSTSLPGVNGPLATAEAFAQVWCERTNTRTSLAMQLRLFELRSVTPPSQPSGSWRKAKPQDLELLVQWSNEFSDESIPNDPRSPIQEVRDSIRDGIRDGHYFVWEDAGRAVCYVGSRRETEAGRWIAPVYTPKALRGRGYASALVAAASQTFVAAGKKCLLFTDLANPTSNSIYQKIGYRPLADFKHLRFLK